MPDKRYKPIGQGLPGPRNFDISDLVDGDIPIWDAKLQRWVRVPNFNITAFGEQLVAEKTPIFELDSTSGLSLVRRDTVTVTGSGAVTEHTDGTFRVRTGATTGSTAQLRTKERGRYQPGIEGLPTLGLYLDGTPASDSDMYWGYYTANDGFWFGYDADGYYIRHRHNGTTEDKVRQADWNGQDKLDGNGPSGLTLDPDYLTIFRFPYLAYGAGPIEFEVILTDRTTGEETRAVVHRIGALQKENIISQWKLPIQVGAENGSTTDDLSIHVGGRAYFVNGLYRPEPRLVPEERDTVPSISDGTTYPLISFRKKSDAKSDGKTVTIADAALISDAEGYLQIWLGTTLSGTTTFNDLSNVSASETALEVNTGATGFTGGELLKSTPVQASSGNSTKQVDFDDIEQILPDDGVIVTLAFTNTSGGGATVNNVVFEMNEEW